MSSKFAESFTDDKKTIAEHDQLFPAEILDHGRRSLEERNLTHEIQVYPGVPHGKYSRQALLSSSLWTTVFVLSGTFPFRPLICFSSSWAHHEDAEQTPLSRRKEENKPRKMSLSFLCSCKFVILTSFASPSYAIGFATIGEYTDPSIRDAQAKAFNQMVGWLGKH